jgi:hypothetical protein
MGRYVTEKETPMKTTERRSSLLIAVSILAISLSCATGAGARNGAHHGMRGLYIPNRQANNPDYIRALIERGKPLGINMLVLDVHPFMTLKARFNPEVISYLKRNGIYIAARIVCFQDGLKSLPVPEEHLDRLFGVMQEAAGAGFDEVQMDYIRFPDGAPYYALSVKYGFIDGLLGKARAIADRRGVRLSADLFGRVVYNRDDIIGQKIENFAKHADVIYPMLYPSHFTDDRNRMANPGETIRDGTQRGLNRVKGTRAGIQPYIQAFPYNIQWAHVPLDRYVELQVTAAESTGARGWVAWNAKGEYECVFKALERL